MAKGKLFSSLMVPVLLWLITAVVAQAKDVNLGWSGQGSWTTLPYVVAKERGVL
jgi:hypothetical protein